MTVGMMKNKYRASIYLDVFADNEQEAVKIAEGVAMHLSIPGLDLPEDYCNPFVGGVAHMIDGDLVGNMKRCENI